ncbi:MAG: VWA domain-containing protein, partial [Candidatus Omnitrophota bacterium]
PSCRFSTSHELKSRLAAEIAAVLSFAAIRNNDKIGLQIFTDNVEKFIPPRKGRRHVLRIIREVLCFSSTGRGTDIAAALEFMTKVTNRRSVCFLISDFIEPLSKKLNDSRFLKAMAIANRRHDIIAVTLNDPREQQLTPCGLLELEDAETGESVCVDTFNSAVRDAYARAAKERLTARNKLFRSMNVDHIDISTDVPYADSIVRFFAQRRRRMR